jgi:hypothetical protein
MTPGAPSDSARLIVELSAATGLLGQRRIADAALALARAVAVSDTLVAGGVQLSQDALSHVRGLYTECGALAEAAAGELRQALAQAGTFRRAARRYGRSGAA